jgi:transposase-like protein
MTKNLDQFQLIPPYCPNSSCLFHFGTETRFYVKNGCTKTFKPPFKNQRYKCKRCGEQFSDNTFSLDFRKRLPDLGEQILHSVMHGMSNNSISRLMGVSEGTIRDRLKTMSRQSLLFEKEHFPKKIFEDVAYDGFETFTHSQFSPCYVNTAVGSRSLFIYHNTFSPLNRKGRMTEEQKLENKNLLSKFGPYPRDSVFTESIYILKSLSNLAPGRTLYTDEHKSYLRAVRSFDFQMEHETISSTERRDARNPLFPINHLHLLYRHFFSSQKRETIAFQKHEAALLEKVQLMKIYRNFMNPKFVKPNKQDKHAHDWSPAMYVGVAKKILKFEEVFGVRRLKSQSRLDEREIAFMNRSYPYSRQKIAA